MLDEQGHQEPERTGGTAAPSRRGLLRGASLAAGAVAALGGTAATATPAAATTRSDPGLARDPLLHLLRRCTWGLTPQLVAEARRLGYRGWLEQQLAPERIDDRACEALVARFPRTTHTARRIVDDGKEWEVGPELARVALTRMAWSRRQLLEVVVDFWSNHLNVTTPSDGVTEHRPTEDRDVVRRHALGRYSDMLVASAQSPAMLRYLDGATSTKGSPNENYGRELLELHSVGRDAGYTEADVRASALLLTGFTIDKDSREFRYRPDWHHVGPLQVMDFRAENATAAGGHEVALQYLRYLAEHPATARRIAHKLCVRFVSDTPPAGLVERLAQVYLSSGTQIVPVLRALLTSAEFTASVGQKTRRPLEDLVATVRGLGIGPDRSGTDGIRALVWMAEARGQHPFGWGPPDGYPDVAAAWAGSAVVLAQMNDRMNLVGGWWPNQLQVCDARRLLPTRPPRTCGELVDALSQRLLHQRLVPAQRDAVLLMVGKPAGAPAGDAQLKWELPYIVATILDTPAWSAR